MVEKFNNTFKDKFLPGEKLYAALMQDIVDKINSIIDAIPETGDDDHSGDGLNDPTTNTKSSIQWMTLDDFEAIVPQDGILYIITDSEGNILFMWLNGKKLEYKESEHSGEIPFGGKITEEEYNSLSNDDKNKNIYIIENNGVAIGIGIKGIIARYPLPASGIVVEVSESDYEAMKLAHTIIATTLYFIYVEENGKRTIIKAYLGENQLELGSDTEGIVRSLISEMWSKKIVWNTDEFGKRYVDKIYGTMIDTSQPGDLYAGTTFENAVSGVVSSAGFISRSDADNIVADVFANKIDPDGNIVKSANVTAKIWNDDTSEVLIDADLITFSSDSVKFNTAVIDALEAELATKTIHLTKLNESSSVNLSWNGLSIHPDLNHTSVALNSDGSGSLANNNISWNSEGDLTITGQLHYNKISGGVAKITQYGEKLLSDDDYFVINEWGNTSSLSSCPTVILPMNPTIGQTIFISCGSGCFQLKANKDIKYAFSMPIFVNGVSGGISGYSVNWGTCNANDVIWAFAAKWTGVVEFIFSGTYWQQLIHNIDTRA